MKSTGILAASTVALCALVASTPAWAIGLGGGTLDIELQIVNDNGNPWVGLPVAFETVQHGHAESGFTTDSSGNVSLPIPESMIVVGSEVIVEIGPVFPGGLVGTRTMIYMDQCPAEGGTLAKAQVNGWTWEFKSLVPPQGGPDDPICQTDPADPCDDMDGQVVFCPDEITP